MGRAGPGRSERHPTMAVLTLSPSKDLYMLVFFKEFSPKIQDGEGNLD